MNFLKQIFFYSLCFIPFLGSSQETTETIDDIFKVDYDTPLTLDLASQQETEIEPVKQKKKKVKKNVFFGIKTRKAYTRTIIRNEVVFEIFNVLKVYEAPPEYARDFYWYDYKKKKIVNSLRIVEANAGVLHGPYKKMIGEQILEEGWYYKGMKHKRWVRLNKYDILQDKTHWWKGWPQESLLSYYDFEKTKLREVIPMHYGERNGVYYAFRQDGTLAAKGDYKFNHRVGLWKEYYDGRRVKREVMYSDDPFNYKFTPYIVKEWNQAGQVIYDKVAFERDKK
jgi:antitoxin component YwqK of YwqJK toxin-antitoxin module